MNKQSDEKRLMMNQLSETYKEEFTKREKAEAELKHLYHSQDSQLNVALRKNEEFEIVIKDIETAVRDKVIKIQELENDVCLLTETMKNSDKMINSLETECEYFR